ILPVTSLNLVLVGLFELQHRELLGPALFHDLAGDRSLGRVRARQNLLVLGMHRKHGPEFHLFAHFTLHPLNADGVARRDTILLSPGLYDCVHRSSKPYRQTTIIRVGQRHGQRSSSVWAAVYL